MSVLEYIIIFLSCLFATVFFALLQKSPRRFILYSALIAAAGYMIYTLLKPQSPLLGYFTATLFISLCSEVFARILKTPASMFMTPAVIPLVPGMGLYLTMLALVRQDLAAAGKEGTATMLAIGVMAGAIALNSFVIRLFFNGLNSYRSRKQNSN
jgi:uncharacterized membrane protein YjjB (DUF3815 family)